MICYTICHRRSIILHVLKAATASPNRRNSSIHLTVGDVVASMFQYLTVKAKREPLDAMLQEQGLHQQIWVRQKIWIQQNEFPTLIESPVSHSQQTSAKEKTLAVHPAPAAQPPRAGWIWDRETAMNWTCCMSHSLLVLWTGPWRIDLQTEDSMG